MKDNQQLVGVIVLVAIAVGAVFTVATFVEVLRQPANAKYQSGTKGVWVAVILLTGVIGALIYQAAGKPVPNGARHRNHVVYIDPRDHVYWCTNCGFATTDMTDGRHHGSVALNRKTRHGDIETDLTAVRKNRELATDSSQSAIKPTGFELPSEVEAPPSVAPSLRSSPESAAAGLKTCPDCAEEIRAAARKCRFCGYRYEEQASAPVDA